MYRGAKRRAPNTLLLVSVIIDRTQVCTEGVLNTCKNLEAPEYTSELLLILKSLSLANQWLALDVRARLKSKGDCANSLSLPLNMHDNNIMQMHEQVEYILIYLI